MKEETLVLNETFKEFRRRCEFRKYYQQYTNYEVIHIGKSLGRFDIDHGHIKCVHPESVTGWCKGKDAARNCPRLEVLYV